MAASALNKRDWIAANSNLGNDGFARSEEAARLHALNCDPALLTDRFRALVPLLEFVEAEIRAVSPERTVIAAPLSASARNQNSTHQASVFYILADYTLGLALFSAVPWVYMIDVHRPCECQPVQMWLLSGQVKHLAPGTGEIVAIASLGSQEQVRARAEFERKRRCRIKGTVRFYQDDKLIALAEHEVGMYAAPAS